MCGIAGFIGPADRAEPELKRLAESMAAALPYRGPDDWGAWADGATGVALGHRRLSIVDLSPAGHQPMPAHDDSGVISYNGEVYNAEELRADLLRQGAGPFRGHSDTEVLAEACARWGVAETASRLIGMFAFAWWDKRTRTLSLVRDRLGIKPLYWARIGRTIAFASELKAFFALPEFKPEIDRGAQAAFLRFAYVPAPRAIYRNVFKLEPGNVLTIGPSGEPSARKFWDARMVAMQAKPTRDPVEAESELHDLLKDAVTRRMIADVPLGAFLSGGVDSSTVVALMQASSPRPVRTFTIGFNEQAFNEADYARAVAQHLGTEHHERIVTAREAQEVIPALPRIYDEPFADASQIPTHLVSAFAREQVKVALSGDGGDELFGGYSRYFTIARTWAALKRVPAPLRAALAKPLSRVPLAAWDRIGRRPYFGIKARKALKTLAPARSLDQVFAVFLDEWSEQGSPVLGESVEAPRFDLALGPGASDWSRMMYCDAVSYLPDDILCKVDRASMAVSLEVHCPFLDHRVAELAARIPVEMKIRGGIGKHVLRQLLYREAPRQLFERPKTGFAIPVGEWIKGPLRDWAESLLDARRLRSQGWLDAGKVERRWREHLSGERDSTGALWSVLMFEAWLEGERDSVA